jgi:chromosome segregation ATPase
MKKLGITLLIIVGALFVFKKTHLGSYLQTAWSGLKNSAKNQVPLEFEIERVRTEIAKLDGDINDQLSPMAEEMATIKSLKGRISEMESNLQKEKANILTMTQDLEKGDKVVSFKDEEYTAEELRVKRDADFAAFKLAEAEYNSQTKMLTAKEKAMHANRLKLAKMKSLKRELELQLANIETEYKTVCLAETADKYQVDDSRLSGIKTALADMKHRLEVRKQRVILNGQFGSDPVATPRPTTTVKNEDVKNYFKDHKDNRNLVAGKK